MKRRVLGFLHSAIWYTIRKEGEKVYFWDFFENGRFSTDFSIFLRMMLPQRLLEQQCLSEGFLFVAGIDEAGRGPLAGSVVAAAAARKNAWEDISESERNLIRDSKTISERRREEAFSVVSRHFFVGVGISDNRVIDRLNIEKATFFSMKKAFFALKRQMRNVLSNEREKIRQDALWAVLIDGNRTLNLSLRQMALVDGDAKEQLIAAASIMAKVTRDREMIAIDREFPRYGFAKHKGYGTKAHLDALKKYGPTPLHRMSFSPVRESITMNAINAELNSPDSGKK